MCNAELYANLGLSCFYAQQYDMALNCFNKALALASDENAADIWYNIGHVALVREGRERERERESVCVCVCVYMCMCIVLCGVCNVFFFAKGLVLYG